MRPTFSVTHNADNGKRVLHITPHPVAFPNATKKTIELTPDEYVRFCQWLGGKLIQDCFPNWPAEKRELLMTGMDDAEFKKAVG